MTATCALIALPDATDAAACGAKAATLARLAHANLPIPDGIVVPANWPTDRLAELIPDLLLWAETRDAPALIARSSAPAEDGTSASFAGMYASAFAPATPDLLLDALEQVRRSAHAPGLPGYAQLAGVEASTTIAILIQPALRPHAAGVAALENLPAEPTGQVEALWGLAEPLASGRRTGEIHVLRHSGSMLAIPSDQPEIVLPCTAADLLLPPGEWITIAQAGAAPTRGKIHLSERNLLRLYTPTTWAGPILAANHVQRVSALAIAAAAELHLDRIDIEWALLPDGQLHLLQARPLTAPLPPNPQSILTDARFGVRQGIPAVAGQGTGPAVHLTSSSLPHLSSDDIRASVIVCDALGPEAVQVLCQQPAAIIAAHGGPLSHTAILAREFGIPCITAVSDAMTTIPPGQHVHVDGSAGTATIQTAPPPDSSPTSHSSPATLAGAAVLSRHVPTDAPTDGRAATIVLPPPSQPNGPDLARFDAARRAHPVPLGVLQLGSAPELPAMPGHDVIHLDRLGQLLWPRGAHLPADLAVLAPDGSVLFQRAVRALP